MDDNLYYAVAVIAYRHDRGCYQWIDMLCLPYNMDLNREYPCILRRNASFINLYLSDFLNTVVGH